MMIGIKRKVGKQWIETTEDLSVIDSYRGQEVVAKISDAVIWCGTKKWYDHYAAKGYVVTDTIDLLGICKLAHEIFHSNREERIAIMEAEGVDKGTIDNYLHSRPDLYGIPQESKPPEQKVLQDSKGQGGKAQGSKGSVKEGILRRTEKQAQGEGAMRNLWEENP